MSDEEEEWVSEEESEPDFSASEDEWRPTKQDKESSDSDFQIDKHSDDEHAGSSRNRKLPKGRSSSSSSSTRGRGASSGSGGPPTKKRFSQSLRNKLYNKYRPPPKTLSPIKVSSSLSNILDSSKYTRKSSAVSSRKDDEEESDSSGADNLVDPNKLDLSSSFFQKGSKSVFPKPDLAPDFDCNVGCLTDSGSDNDDDDDPEEQPQTTENFSKLHNFNSTLERAREALKKYQANNIERASEESKVDDIGAILAAGEKAEDQPSRSKPKLAPKRKATAVKHDSDSEWEEVNELEVKRKTEPSRADGGVEITVQLPGGHERKRNKQLELELCLKRKLNRIKKENQLDLHKANVLCWIAHMNYVNQILNNPILMATALKMIPSSNCYPKDKTDIDYFEQLSGFYKTVIVIKNNTEYPPIKKRPSLELSLGLQIKNKTAICKRDFVFIFVILARAIGLQCRIVHNFVVAPIRPALADLVPINRMAETKKIKKNVKKEDVKDETPNQEASRNVKKDSSEAGQSSSTKIKEEPPKILQPNKTETMKPETKTKKEPSKVVAKKATLKTTESDKKNENVIESKTNLKSIQPQEPSKAKTKKTATPNKKNDNVIQYKTIEKSIQGQKSVNLSKLKLAKQNGGPLSPVNSPIKTRSRASNKVLNIDQLDGADDDFAEPVRKRQTRAKKVDAKEIPSSTSKNPKRKSTLTLEKKEQPVEPSPSTSKTTTFEHQKLRTSGRQAAVKPGSSQEKPGSSQEKPANLAKLKANNNKGTSKRPSTTKSVDDSDEDFRPSPIKKVTTVKNKTNRPVSAATNNKLRKSIDRRCLSPDDEATKKKNGSDYWVELYSEKSKRWYCVDLFKAKVDCAEDLYKQATHPVAYVLAWQNDNTLKDVSPRYCPLWNTTTRTLRVPQYWLDEAFKGFLGKKTDRDKREDLELNKLHMDQPLPKVIGEFKNHPLYALRRHLLKFEEIYPPDALTLGFIRNEPIYARECVHTLHSREIWLKQARVVKLGETPYKIVTARPKWDRLTQTLIKGVPLEIFGIWQTKEYDPPTAENGIVPRNAYGNVELFKECMLPKKTLHLRLNGLNRVCKKLGIDCAPAVVGFDFHSGSCHPVFDGFVICEEFGDKVVDAWFDDQAEQEKREREKYEKRVYGNWKRVIRGLLIREKIKIKYKLEPLKLDD